MDDANGPDRVAPESGEPELEGGAAGTLFIMVLFLMALAGLWGIMFFKMLEL